MGSLATLRRGFARSSDRVGGKSFNFERAMAIFVSAPSTDGGSITLENDFVGYIIAAAAGGRGGFGRSTNNRAAYQATGGAGGGSALAYARLPKGSVIPYRIGAAAAAVVTMAATDTVEGQPVSSGVAGLPGEDTWVDIPGRPRMRAFGGQGGTVTSGVTSGLPIAGPTGASGEGGDRHFRGGDGGAIVAGGTFGTPQPGGLGDNSYPGGQVGYVGTNGRGSGGGALGLPPALQFPDLRTAIRFRPYTNSENESFAMNGGQVTERIAPIGAGSGAFIAPGAGDNSRMDACRAGSGALLLFGAYGLFTQ